MPRRKKDELRKYTAVFKTEHRLSFQAKDEAEAMKIAVQYVKDAPENVDVLEYRLIDDSRTDVVLVSNKGTKGGKDGEEGSTILPGSEGQSR